MQENFYVIQFSKDKDYPYCRLVYDFDNEHNLILNGYSLMKDWKDATLFTTKQDAIKTILENKEYGKFGKEYLKVINIKIESEIVYE